MQALIMIKDSYLFSHIKGSTIIFQDEFDAACLDQSKWLPAYLPSLDDTRGRESTIRDRERGPCVYS